MVVLALVGKGMAEQMGMAEAENTTTEKKMKKVGMEEIKERCRLLEWPRNLISANLTSLLSSLV